MNLQKLQEEIARLSLEDRARLRSYIDSLAVPAPSPKAAPKPSHANRAAHAGAALSRAAALDRLKAARKPTG
jgi:hypothetical protein